MRSLDYGCAAAASPEKGIETVLDIGQNLHEADKLLAAALAVSQMSKS
jgi:hypothetical protein